MMEALFNKWSLGQALNATCDALRAEIAKTPEDYILKVNANDFVAHLTSQYSTEVPTLNVDARRMLPPQEYPSGALNFGREVPATATLIEVVVPFRGDATLFHCTPSRSSFPRPMALLGEEELRLMYSQVEHDEAQLRQRHEQDLRRIQDHLDALRPEVEEHNCAVAHVAREAFEARHARLMSSRALAASLKLPLQRAPGTSDAYSVPLVRRSARVVRPPVSDRPWKPEIELDAAEYERVLDLLDRMGQVIERSPQAVARMDEENLRFLFLIPLNSHYEGGATGETFNFSGKTDILLQHDGRSVFIAECKIWDGPKVLTGAIDQLLGYLSWRDTKTALLLFSRNREFSTVLAQIPTVVRQHPCFVEDRGRRSETSFRFVLHQPNDAERKLSLTVVAFDVPRP